MLNLDAARSDAESPRSVDETRARILWVVPAPRGERVPLDRCLGRVIVEMPIAARDQPPFDAAAMDGWAIGDGPALRRRIVGESRAGHRFGDRLGIDDAVLISTGAPLPPGASRVLRRERGIMRNDHVEFMELPSAGSDVRAAGGDFSQAMTLLAAGTRLRPLDLALLSAAGIAAPLVASQPRVAILPTGDEIVPPGERPGSDQIHDALSLPLVARIAQAGGLAEKMAPLRDDIGAIRSRLDGADADIILLIGGASHGTHDLAKTALCSLGLSILVPSVLIRPGKPVWFGKLGDGRLVLGLPGNPVAALICAELFLVPLLRAWQGASPAPSPVSARCAAAAKATGVLEHWLFARIEFEPDGSISAIPLGGRDSAALTPVIGANALLRFPANMPARAVGEPVSLFPIE